MFFIITVVYNQLIQHTSILKTDLQNIKLLFADNSTKEEICLKNKNFCNENDFGYLGMNGNKGLSKAYNEAMHVINPSTKDFVVILDQDTEIPIDIIEKYEVFLSKHQTVDIICPIVFDSVGVMSPSISCGLKFKHIKSIEYVNQKNIADYSFINSGICIKGSVFEKLKYDENLFLDLVDHDFILSSKKEKFKIAICFDVILNQSFSGVTRNSYAQDYSRFLIYLNDAKYFYKKWFDKNYKFVLFPRAIKLCLIHKKISFLKLLIKN